ncbi:hypothetical protein H4J02_11200 [Protaetiibacter sp. SSC-01]|uniref:hypothetical protein n=1 Tax=Protaetiibacter sp. SSC-01 TaxID=2759943 RepID=UPI001656C7DC|nr:hypothetical protein [Protaetiibacter sp. SSC-01]QNO37020.1 hypothetical protein H4J02_11200 [Protaetiibacter sp. SSC-01]
MKRTGIFALAAGCAMGATALVGGIGYASALDVAEQTGRSIDVAGVSTVDGDTKRLADSPKLDPSAEPSDEATADDAPADGPVESDEVVPPVVDDDGTGDQGSGDQGSGDAVDEVDPSDPIVIDDRKKSDKRCGSFKQERAAWLAAQDGDPAVGGDGKTWTRDGSEGWGDARSGDKNRGEKSWGDKSWVDGSRSGEHGPGSSWDGTSDRGGDRHGDGHRSGKGGGGHHGGKHGGGGWGGGRH